MIKRSLYLDHVFSRVLEFYNEIRERRGTYSSVPSEGNRGGAKYKPFSGVSISDFLADFEIACRRHMNRIERWFFKRKYIDNYISEKAVLTNTGKELDEAVRTKGGRALKEHHLYPIHEYFLYK